MSFGRQTILGAFCAAGMFLTSCGTFLPERHEAAAELQNSGILSADRLLKKSHRFPERSEAAAVYQLRAAELAWGELDTNGGHVASIRDLSETQKQALHLITSATETVALHFIGSEYRPEKTFSHAGFTYRVTAGIDPRPGIYPLSGLESAKPARKVRRTLVQNWHIEEGIGAPCAPKWKRPENTKIQRFVSSRSYLEPITAVLTFGSSNSASSRSVDITGYDPTHTSRINLGKTSYPLAADFTAPIVEQTNDINEITIALTGLIHPGALDSRLILLEPHDPDKIPVLLVHGLNSHPRMWRDVINDLRADPELRGRFQFMLFYYPTGWPIPYASMRLREELHALAEQTRPRKKMIVIGHSMGGLLARMQVITPERRLWDQQFGAASSSLLKSLRPSSLLERVSFFTANPHIGREIYICTPHRGSGIADLSMTALFIRILSVPSKITEAFINLPGNLVHRGQLTSVGGLSPANPLFRILPEIPIEVPHHSIIGDRGRGGLSNSSDGVVPYWSSHLNSAESELVVSGNHGAYDDPAAIREMRRILLLHAGRKKRVNHD